jgi:aryl-alcohol dehydrogenase-like predicted oxidoreductase
MEHRPLGRTGVSVSKLCLGTMMFGDWGTKDHDESIRIIHRALDAGINFVDTADVYSQGESEIIVGKALKGRRDDVVLATKFTRNIENEILPLTQRYGMGMLSYSPLAGGWLSGRYRNHDQTGPMSEARKRLANRFDLSLPENQRKLDAADQLGKVADEAGISLIELAIAFVLRHPAITTTIIRPRTMEHLESQLAAADIVLSDDVLSDDVLDRIDEIVAPGVSLNPADNGWVSPSLQPAARRR